MPQSNIHFAVFMDGIFSGAMTFGTGGSDALGKKYGVLGGNVVELRRVAFRPDKKFQTSQPVAVALRALKRQKPEIKLVVSFADSGQNHYGGIYQAMGWVYLGKSIGKEWVVNGRRIHTRTVNDNVQSYNQHNFPFLTDRKYVERFFGDNAVLQDTPPKFRYGLALQKSIANVLKRFALPYPKQFNIGNNGACFCNGGKNASCAPP